MSCRFVSTTEPRVIPGRHATGCINEECTACLPCLETHCSRCNHIHAAVTCVECINRTRADLHRIMDLCLMVPMDRIHWGARLADPDDWRRAALQAMLGRVCQCPDRGMVCPTVRGRICPDAAYLEDCHDEPHALTVLGDWDEMWRGLLSHETEQRMSLGRAFSYLDMQLAYMADQEWAEFDQFSREIRACRVYLERGFRDDDQPEVTDVPCLSCSRSLIKVYGRLVADDHWRCPRKSCGRVYSEAEFNLAKSDHLAGERANRFLRVSDAAGLTQRPEQTIRAWMCRDDVETSRDARTGALMVWWPHVRALHLTAATRKRKAI